VAKKTRPSSSGDRARRQQARQDRRASSTTSLSRERIVREALTIVDRDGLEALSMRRLGKELGVDPMAVYYYLPNKDALLDAIVEAVMSAIDLAVDDPSAPPEDRVVWAARAYRDAMLAHANALPIVLTRGPRTPAAARPVELLISIFRDAGLPPTEAMTAMNTVAAAVRGLAGMLADASGEARPPSPDEIEALARQFPAEEFPNLREAFLCSPEYSEAEFDSGIRAIARGLLTERR
jgi:TetR/AcrR family tetracycline transcriptional repressor